MNPKLWVLLALAVVSFLSGAIGQYFYPGVAIPPSTLWSILPGSILLFAWYRLDAAQIGYRRSPWLNIGVIGLALVALPYYFFRSRGAKHGFVAVALFVLTLIAFQVLSIAGMYSAYYMLQK